MFPYAPQSPVGQWFCSKRWGISLFKDHLDIGFNNSWAGDFPSGPVVKTTHFQCRAWVCNPWLGNLVAWPKENTQKSKKKPKKPHTQKNYLLGCVDLQMFLDLSGLQLPSINNGGGISVQGSWETWKWMNDLATCLHYWSVPFGEKVGKSRSYFFRSRIQKLEEVYPRRQFGHALIAEHPVVSFEQWPHVGVVFVFGHTA